MGEVPLSILKELEHQARQNISTLEKYQNSLKSTFKKVKSQIQKGANPEKAAKHGYQEACEYLDLWNKTILIQHRALARLSKSLAQMPHLHPLLETPRTQEFTLFASPPAPVSISEGGRGFPPQKRHLKRLSGFRTLSE